jgi:23S rRNA (guanosine2251-2'-O)-methyltransferase
VYIFGRNAVQEALSQARENPRTVEKILFQYGADTAPIQAIRRIAEHLRIPISVMDKRKFQNLEHEVCGDVGRAQGVFALTAAMQTLSVSQLIENSFTKHESPLLVVLDGITDPHNVGAIARSAECAGFHGMIVPEQRSAPLSGAAMKSSAGALEHLPVAKTSNLIKALEDARNAGFEILALEANSDTLYTADVYQEAIVLVIGSEGAGISKQVRDFCTGSIAIPLHGKIPSLNASVATGVVMFEIVRQRWELAQAVVGTHSA